MALQKTIELGSGVTVTYHRVVSVNNITNIESKIEVASYISADKRKEEKEKLASNEPMDIFIYTEYLDIAYTQELDVVGAYNYLKTLDEFSDAQDV